MIKNILSKFGYVPKRETRFNNIALRNFLAAQTSNLLNSWNNTNDTVDSLLRMDLQSLRGRCRSLERNNSYAKRAFSMIERGVVGKDGFLLQAQGVKNGELDFRDNELVEEKWQEFCDKEYCDVTGQRSFRDICKTIIRHLVRDGEIIVRKIEGANNKFGISAQLLEADHLDENHNDVSADGNKIKMGIEQNDWGRPVKYWLYKEHPGDTFWANYSYSDKVGIDAKDIYHLYVPSRVSMSRGYPWLAAGMIGIYHVGKYTENELVASRIAAAKMGFISGEETSFDSLESENDDGTGSLIQEVNPGMIEYIGQNKFESFDPQHPNAIFGDFIKAMLREVASSIDIGYNHLANDYESTSWSSLRSAELDTRESFRDIQTWLIEHFIYPFYLRWLANAMLTKALPIPFSEYDKLKNVHFQPRGYDWVDPKSEIGAKLIELKMCATSLTRIAKSRGENIEDIFKDLSREKMLKKKYDLTSEVDAEILNMLGNNNDEK
jgi:lambda family phage portal protein